MNNVCRLTSEGLVCTPNSAEFWTTATIPSRRQRRGRKINSKVRDGLTQASAFLVSFPLLNGLTVPSGGGVGWFEINFEIGSTLQVHTYGSGDVDTQIGLYGTNGILIASSDTHIGDRSAVSSALEAGTYFVAAGLWRVEFANDFSIIHTPYQQDASEVLVDMHLLSLGNRGFTGLFNTGQNIADGIIDCNYVCTYRDGVVNFPATRIPKSAVPTAQGGYFAEGYSWSDNSDESGWISFGNDAATYLVEMNFDLTGYNHTTASLSLLIQSQHLDSVYVNPTSISTPTDNQLFDGSNATDQWPSSRIKNGGFLPGINRVLFKFFNYDPGPLTMNIRATGTAVPNL